MHLRVELERSQVAAESETAAEKTKGDALKKCYDEQANEAQKLEVQASKSHGIISQLEMDLESMRSEAQAESAAAESKGGELRALRSAEAKAAQISEAHAADTRSNISQLQAELETLRNAAEVRVTTEKARADELENMCAERSDEAKSLQAEAAKSIL